MNIALILSTLMLGIAPIDAQGGSGNSPQISSPTSGLSVPPAANKTTVQKPQAGRSSSKSSVQSAPRPQSRTTRMGSSSMRNQQANGQANDLQLMPLAPTDPMAGVQAGQPYLWQPPTATPSTAGIDTSGRPVGAFGPMNATASPTRAPLGMPNSYASMQTAQQQNRRAAAVKSASVPTVAPQPKAFAGAQSMGSGVSPYMNLFRNGNNNGTVDNYSTLVRPELEQRRANHKFGTDLNGLERSTYSQGSTIRQLNRDTMNLQGANATQRFMNYGDYYPGLQ